MELNDQYFNIGGIMTEYEDGFYVERQPNRELPYKNRW